MLEREGERERKKLDERELDPFKVKSFHDEIVSYVTEEYERRKREKNFLEVQWQLNFDFLDGRQYSIADFQKSETVDLERASDSQERVVYNEIAPIFETRCARLRQLNKFMSVISSTAENDDIKNAEISTEILKNTYNSLDFDSELLYAVNWSEICGSAFLKNVWNNNSGELVGYDKDGSALYSGEIETCVISPFEIFPESLSKQKLSEQTSIIHAKVFSRDDLFYKYGIEINGSENSVYQIANVKNVTGGYDYLTTQTVALSKENMPDSAVVIEYYERPNRFYPEGRLIVVCEDRILTYQKKLPFQNGRNQSREFPFVKFDCISKINSFFGSSVIERLIPVQQNYNAVHNRINEYLKRATIGVPLLEEDSLVNEADVEENGFTPGCPVIYQKGANAPRFMETPPLPATFINKLEELKQDFIVISGISEIARNSHAPGAVTSGVGIQLLQQQDDTRLSLSGKNILSALKECGVQWLYLYKEFATTDRVVRYTGISYPIARKWNQNTLSSFDITVCEDSNMFSNTALTRELAGSLQEQGFFNQDKYGMLSYLSILKNGDINKAFQEEFLDVKNAEKENYLFEEENKIPVVREEDDHELHLKIHNIFRKSDWYRDVLYQEEGAKLAELFGKHCEEHKGYLKESEEAQNEKIRF